MSMVKGIALSSQGWTCAAQNQIATGQFVRGNWNINTNV